MYLQSNCKLARLRRIMLRSLAEVNRKVVALIVLYKLRPATEESQSKISAEDLYRLPETGSTQSAMNIPTALTARPP